jgi:hypothetical protein
MRFILLVEGDTEKLAIADFLKRWLDPQLKQPLGVQVVNFHGNSQFVRKIVSKAQDYLAAPEAGEIMGVVGLLDLYGLDIYPVDRTTVKERHDWGVQHFQAQVSREKFRMFFAVHEFEAWILGQPDVLPREVREALPATVANPERIDFDEPPGKLLKRVYLSRTGRTYKKTTYGKQLFGKLAPDVVVGKCPYLKAMLSEMLAMAKAAGLTAP